MAHEQHYAVFLTGGTTPVFVCRIEDGRLERFVPRHGYILWPSLYDYFTGSETGLTAISAEQALILEEAGIGELSDQAVAAGRGTG